MKFFDNPVLRVQLPAWRARALWLTLCLGFVALLARALYLQGLSTEFLQRQGERRYERTLALPAVRGKILDRNGIVLAASTPARAIWAIPEDARALSDADWRKLAQLLEIPAASLRARLTDATDKNFVYLKRQVSLETAAAVEELQLPGVHQQPETRRVYPEAGVMAHLVGFAGLEGRGQEGLELAFDDWLAGRAGSRRVIRDRLGQVIEDVQAASPPKHGRDLMLSIDTRLQYVVYKALASAMVAHRARAAAAIVLDVETGEILALANLPAYDPNQPASRQGEALRNRALTDAFEPGSVLKPFTAALALELGAVKPETQFDTGRGAPIRLYGETISDVSKNGVIDVAGVLRRSSNIGMALITDSLPAAAMWTRLTELGLGQPPNVGFPGTAAGRLRPWERWRPIEKITMSYGYGVSASLAQLARAFTVFARDGDMVSLSLVRRTSQAASVPVYRPDIARTVRAMLEAATGAGGTPAAQVQGYRVAGKSGTARKIVNGRYSSKHFRASFVGFAPVSNPKILVAVSIDEPSAGAYFGGAVAAPVFADIVADTLRMLGVAPDGEFASSVATALNAGAPRLTAGARR